MPTITPLITSVSPLAGSDDRIARVEIDESVSTIGGLWIEYRCNGCSVVPWDAHPDAQFLPNIDAMYASAICALRNADAARWVA